MNTQELKQQMETQLATAKEKCLQLVCGFGILKSYQ